MIGSPVDADHSGPETFFGEALPGVLAFHDLLDAEGEMRGLIGPREVERLWERHLLNSGAVAGLVGEEGTLVDIGSGGGFPGVVIALMRPGLRVVLVESMLRRTEWLEHVVTELRLANVEVVRGRAEELGELGVDVVTARAVAPLDRLAGWAMPLLRAGGELLALKGQRAATEMVEARAALGAWGGGEPELLTVPTIEGVEPVAVVRVVREQRLAPRKASKRRR